MAGVSVKQLVYCIQCVHFNRCSQNQSEIYYCHLGLLQLVKQTACGV